MTQSSHQDDLPPGPYRIDGHTVLTEDGTVFAWAHGKTPEQGYAIARAIAAIPEMRAELDLLRAEMDYNVSIRDRLKLLEDSNRDLRAEKAELQRNLAIARNLLSQIEINPDGSVGEAPTKAASETEA